MSGITDPSNWFDYINGGDYPQEHQVLLVDALANAAAEEIDNVLAEYVGDGWDYLPGTDTIRDPQGDAVPFEDIAHHFDGDGDVTEGWRQLQEIAGSRVDKRFGDIEADALGEFGELVRVVDPSRGSTTYATSIQVARWLARVDGEPFMVDGHEVELTTGPAEITIRLLQDNAIGLYLQCGENGEVWPITGADEPGNFLSDVRGWIDGEWDPADELEPTSERGLKLVADYHLPSGQVRFHDEPGAAADEYIGPDAGRAIVDVYRGEIAPGAQGQGEDMTEWVGSTRDLPKQAYVWLEQLGVTADDPDLWVWVSEPGYAAGTAASVASETFRVVAKGGSL